MLVRLLSQLFALTLLSYYVTSSMDTRIKKLRQPLLRAQNATCKVFMHFNLSNSGPAMRINRLSQWSSQLE